jgi:hypothetical protein
MRKMIENLFFFGIIVGLIGISYFINYYKFGEQLSVYPKNSMIFLLRDQDKVNQIQLLVFLTFINKGLRKVEITDISLNLIADKIQISFISAPLSEFLRIEKTSREFPRTLDRNERYDSIVSFTISENPRDQLKPLFTPMDGKETLISGKYVMEIIVKYGTGKERITCLKLDLDENYIQELPEIVEDRIILPIQKSRKLWGSNKRKKVTPRKQYRW